MNLLIGYMNKNLTGINLHIRKLIENMNRTNVNITILTRNYDEELEEYLKSMNCKLITIHHNKYFIKALNDMNSILKKVKFDVCYFNISESFDCIGIISAKINKIPKIIIHSHSMSIESKNKVIKFLKNILNSICKIFTSGNKNILLACSDEAAKWLFSKNTYKNGKYRIIRNSIDCDKYKFVEEKRDKIRKKIKLNDKDILIGNVASFRKAKNQTFLIDIIEEISNNYNKNTKLMLVGGTDNAQEIFDKIKEKGVEDRVIITGEVDNVEDYLNAMDVFVFPSLFEGFGMVTIEAQANGLPCIFSTNVPNMTKVTDLVKYISLEEEISKWIEPIIEFGKRPRTTNDYYKRVANAGYDFKNEIIELENIIKE